MATDTVTYTPDADRDEHRWRRRPGRRPAVALGIVLALAGMAVLTTIGGPRGMHGPSPLLPADVRGIYETADGQQVTLLGRAAHPYVEIDGTQLGLVADGDDRFVSWSVSDVEVVLERDPRGSVHGLVLNRSGRATVEARRLDAYTEEEVTFASDGAVLSGTLLLPEGPGPHPAIVVVHGAERSTREVYRLQATHHARRGLAVLFYDKRGMGESTGDVDDATFDDLTIDALAGVELLRTHPQIDPSRIGVYGMSQGGWIAALAAQRSDDVAFVTTVSPSGFSPADQNAWLYGSMLTVRGMGPRPVAAGDRFVRMLYSTTDLVDAGLMRPIPHAPGFWFHALDPYLDTPALWEGVDQPVLALWGSMDCQVPAHDSAAALRDALEAGGNRTYTLRVIEGADHGLYYVGPCDHEIGMHHSSVAAAEDFFAGVAEWVHRLGHDAPRAEYELAPVDATSPLGWHQGPPQPAPWYGTALAQLAAILLLLASFGYVTVRGVVRGRRGRVAGTAVARLTTVTSAVGLATTICAVTALIELAFLGAVHSGQIVGDGPVAGMPPLFLVAGVLVTLVVGSAVALVLAVVGERGGTVPVIPGELRAAVVALMSAALLVAWAGYWQMPFVLPGLF